MLSLSQGIRASLPSSLRLATSFSLSSSSHNPSFSSNSLPERPPAVPRESTPWTIVRVPTAMSLSLVDAITEGTKVKPPYGLLQKLLRKRRIYTTPGSDPDGWTRLKQATPHTKLSPGTLIRLPKIVVEESHPAKPLNHAKRAPLPPLTPEEAIMIQSAVIYADSAIMAINKPHGLACHGGPELKTHVDRLLDAFTVHPPSGTPKSIAKSWVIGRERPKLVHRLDKDTSGVLLLARTSEAASRLLTSFRGGSIKKTYWAFVVGRPVPRSGKIVMPLRKALLSKGNEKMVIAPPTKPGPAAKTGLAGMDDLDSAFAEAFSAHDAAVLAEQAPPDDSLPAETDYFVVQHALQAGAWVRFNPVTGRKHQVRVHSASVLNTPVLGDYKYGPGVPPELRELMGKRAKMHLHARHVQFNHPMRPAQVVSITAPLPPHMVETWKRFEWPTNKEMAYVPTAFE